MAPHPTDRPGSPGGRATWPLALPTLLALGGILLMLSSGRDVPGDPVDRSPRGAPRPAREEPNMATLDERAAMHLLCRQLGFPPVEDPWMTLEMVFDSRDRGLLERAHRLLEKLPDSDSRRYFEIRYLEELGRHDALQARVAGMDYQAAVSTYWQGKTRVLALANRLPVEGPAARAPDPGRVARVLGDCRAMDLSLAAVDDLVHRLLRVELWDLMARRIHGRPEVDLAGMELANELLFRLTPEVAATAGYLRAETVLLAMRFAGFLGEPHRGRAVRERFEAIALAAVDPAPEVRQYWRGRFGEDVEKLTGSVVYTMLSHQTIRFRLGPSGLPFPPDWPGAGDAATPVVIQARRPPVLLRPSPAEGLVSEVRTRAREARLEGRPLGAEPGWLTPSVAHSLLGSGGPVHQELLEWPGLLLELAPRLGAMGQGARLGAMLRDSDRRTRTRRGYVPQRRLYHAPPWSTLAGELLAVPGDGAAVDPEALSRALALVEGFSAHPPPWTLDEVEGMAALLDRVDWVHGPCQALGAPRQRARGLALVAVFEQVAGQPAGSLAEGAWVARGLDLAVRWALDASRAGAPPQSVLRLLEALAPDDAGRVAGRSVPAGFTRMLEQTYLGLQLGVEQLQPAHRGCSLAASAALAGLFEGGGDGAAADPERLAARIREWLR